MTIQEQIKIDMVNAMKTKNTAVLSLLRVVTGEFSRESNSKELSDAQAIKIIRKMHETAKELANLREVSILEKYLPKMLNENSIRIIITEIIQENNYSSMQDMGKVMGKIKQLPTSALIDGKIASTITRQYLAN